MRCYSELNEWISAGVGDRRAATALERLIRYVVPHPRVLLAVHVGLAEVGTQNKANEAIKNAVGKLPEGGGRAFNRRPSRSALPSICERSPDTACRRRHFAKVAGTTVESVASQHRGSAIQGKTFRPVHLLNVPDGTIGEPSYESGRIGARYIGAHLGCGLATRVSGDIAVDGWCASRRPGSSLIGTNAECRPKGGVKHVLNSRAGLADRHLETLHVVADVEDVTRGPRTDLDAEEPEVK